jgi:hypothetical protein
MFRPIFSRQARYARCRHLANFSFVMQRETPVPTAQTWNASCTHCAVPLRLSRGAQHQRLSARVVFSRSSALACRHDRRGVKVHMRSFLAVE